MVSEMRGGGEGQKERKNTKEKNCRKITMWIDTGRIERATDRQAVPRRHLLPGCHGNADVTS